MGRLDDQFLNTLSRVRKDLQSIKNAQYMGSDIIHPKKIPYSNSTYDYSTNGFLLLVFNFTAANQSQPNGLPVFDVFSNSSGTSFPPLVPPNSTQPFNITLQDTSHLVPGGQLEYYVNINALTGSTFYFKAYMLASDEGAFTIT